jgi:hypothetical protein
MRCSRCQQENPAAWKFCGGWRQARGPLLAVRSRESSLDNRQHEERLANRFFNDLVWWNRGRSESRDDPEACWDGQILHHGRLLVLCGLLFALAHAQRAPQRRTISLRSRDHFTNVPLFPRGVGRNNHERPPLPKICAFVEP